MVAPKSDIRKVESSTHLYYESVEERLAHTFTGRLKGITEAGRYLLGKRQP